MPPSLTDILSSLLNGVQGIYDVSKQLARTVPSDTSGQLSASAIVQTGFVRVLGVDVIVGGAAGGLYDAATVALAVAGTQSHVVGTTVGYTPLNIVLKNGLVYIPGAAQVAVIYYARV